MKSNEKEIVDKLNNSKDIDSQLFYFNKIKTMILAEGKELGKQEALLQLGKPTQEQLKAVAEKAIKQFAEEIIQMLNKKISRKERLFIKEFPEATSEGIKIQTQELRGIREEIMQKLRKEADNWSYRQYL